MNQNNVVCVIRVTIVKIRIKILDLAEVCNISDDSDLISLEFAISSLNFCFARLFS